MSTPETALPAGYAEVLSTLKAEVTQARLRAQRIVNTQLLQLYWTIGDAILAQQRAEDWGGKVIERLAADLRAEFPDMKGFSRANLYYMRSVAETWPHDFVQQPVGRLPWGHITVLLDKLDDRAERNWYAAEADKHGWSRKVLLNQIINQLHRRVGAAPSNFAGQLPVPDSELAQELTKDPYVFDFLGITERARERDIEQALMDRLQQVLLELGRGFAFVGRQVHLDVEGEDFYLDLLLFHVTQLRYVVIELKIGRFEPSHVGQLGFYVAVVDAQIRDSDIHTPTVGILLCASRNDAVVHYALANSSAPMAVANYTTEPLDPAQLDLPAPAELEAILREPLDAGDPMPDPRA